MPQLFLEIFPTGDNRENWGQSREIWDGNRESSADAVSTTIFYRASKWGAFDRRHKTRAIRIRAPSGKT